MVFDQDLLCNGNWTQNQPLVKVEIRVYFQLLYIFKLCQSSFKSSPSYRSILYKLAVKSLQTQVHLLWQVEPVKCLRSFLPDYGMRLKGSKLKLMDSYVGTSVDPSYSRPSPMPFRIHQPLVQEACPLDGQRGPYHSLFFLQLMEIELLRCGFSYISHLIVTAFQNTEGIQRNVLRTVVDTGTCYSWA